MATLALHRLTRHAEAAFMEEAGIGMSQLGVLYFLETAEGAMLKDVSAAIGVNPPAASGLIERMVGAGLIRRTRDAGDARAAQLYITKLGRSRAAQATPVLSRLNATLMAGFSETDLHVVATFLRNILTRF